MIAEPGARRLRVAAIDIGTVTTRMLVADTDGVSIDTVARRTVVTHLGEGLHVSGSLSEEGIGRVADAVASFVSEAAALGADITSAVATSAARDAKNGERFIERVSSVGVTPRIIAGATEAALSFTGATWGMDDDGILVADLGGGSTELVLGSARVNADGHGIDVQAAHSFDVGSRRVTDMFLPSDPPLGAEVTEARGWISDQMRAFFESLPMRPKTLITLAGTGTTLVAVREGMAVYDPDRVHLSRLTAEDVTRLRERFAAMTEQDRRRVVGMDPARANVIVAGAVILETIMALAGLDSTVVSEHDLLHGLVLDGWERASPSAR